jgi:fatty acid desaturase
MLVKDILTNEERLDLLRKNNAEGGVMVISTWGFIFFILSLAGHFPGLLSTALCLILLPGRQLSLAVLMHEAGHGTLFTSRRLNQWVGQWLCALPTLGNLSTYATGHLEHHRLAGTRRDPDLPNYRAYPIIWESFRRKVWRDLTGQTGTKLLLSLAKGGAGNMEQPGVSDRFLLVKQVFVQTVIFGFLFLAGIGWTWLLWFVTFMTTYMLVIRLRQIAEHAAVPDLYDPDPRLNTRTVSAPLWQRFLIAPSFVNYHLEHHLMPGVPCYNLPALRTLLEKRGFFLNTPTCRSYHQLLRLVIT